MSDHVPFEIQIEIMKWLPVKSLIQFRSVSKTWKSLISSSKFIADYTKLQYSQRQHVLIQYNHPSYHWLNSYVSIVDDDTFPEHSLLLTKPTSLILEKLELVGSSHGLFCFVGQFCSKLTNIPKKAVIWNPSLSISIAIYVRNSKNYDPYNEYFFLAFGVCPNTLDPKIIKICKFDGNMEVEVFTLSLKVWRSPLSNNMLSKNVNIAWPNINVVIDGLIYWLACETRERIYMIVSFDLTIEEFMEIQLPDEFKSSYRDDIDLRIFKLRESLVVVQHKMKTRICEVWKMEINGVTRSFTNLFNINILPDLSEMNLCGLTKNGHLILKKVRSIEGSSDLVAYDPCTESIYNLGINGKFSLFDVTSYSESLLLLDKPKSSIIYGRRHMF